jgi:hypothetical protein
MAKNKHKFKPSQEPTKGAKILPHAATSAGSTNNFHPIFNLEHLEGDYCLSRCEDGDKAAFADTLHKLSKLTWREIQQSPRHASGTEIIPRHMLGSRSFPAEVTEDVNILAFRFSGTKAMVGYRRDRVFIVLHLDRDFTLYNHG